MFYLENGASNYLRKSMFLAENTASCPVIPSGIRIYVVVTELTSHVPRL
jgi:hypothetical protein